MISARRIVHAAGLAVALAAAHNAAAQTDFQWASPADGLWTDTAAWSPSGSPGLGSPLDTATLGLTGPYTVTLSANRTVATVEVVNPEAMLTIRSGFTLSIGDALAADGTLLISDQSSSSISRLSLADGAILAGNVSLNGSLPFRAVLAAPADPDTSATLAPGTVISGNGQLSGNQMNSAALVLADGTTIELLVATINQAQDGAIVADNGATLAFGSNRVVNGGAVELGADSTLTGTPIINNAGVTFGPGSLISGNAAINNSTVGGPTTLRAGNTLTLGTGNTHAGSITVGDPSSSSVATVSLADGAELGADVILNGSATFRAVLSAPNVEGAAVTFVPGTFITGTGRIQARTVHSAAEILADGTEMDILVTAVNQTPAASVTADNGAELDTNATFNGGSFTLGADSTLTGSPTIADADVMFGPGSLIAATTTIAGSTIGGTATIRAGSTLTLGTGNTHAGSITVGDPSSSSVATVSLADGAELGGDVIFNGSATFRAVLNAPAAPGTAATLVPGTSITGTGRMNGHRFISSAAILADATTIDILVGSVEQTAQGSVGADNGGTINTNAAISGGAVSIGTDGTLTGSPTITDADVTFGPGSLITAGSTGISGSTIGGTATLRAGSTLNLGAGNTHAGSITVSDQSSSSIATVSLADGAELGGDVFLNGFPPFRAVINGTNATLRPDMHVSGRGRLTGTFLPFAGTLAPGYSSGGAVIEIQPSAPFALTDDATTEINLFDTADFGRIEANSNAALALAGELVVTPQNGFTPARDQQFQIVSAPGRSGEFSTVTYNGPLAPNEAPRVFYAANAATFAVVCEADFAFPVGVLDIFDVLVFLDRFEQQHPEADLAPPFGVWDIFDVLQFLQAFDEGC